VIDIYIGYIGVYIDSIFIIYYYLLLGFETLLSEIGINLIVSLLLLSRSLGPGVGYTSISPILSLLLGCGKPIL
jgi:hypothetical protein